MNFDLPHSILSVSKDFHLRFYKFIGRNPFDLRIKPSIFSYPLSSSFSSFSNPFLAENSCVVGEDVVATLTDAATIARSNIAAPQIDIEDGDVRADFADDVVASINPPSTISFDCFGYLPQPELTSYTSE